MGNPLIIKWKFIAGKIHGKVSLGQSNVDVEYQWLCQVNKA